MNAITVYLLLCYFHLSDSPIPLCSQMDSFDFVWEKKIEELEPVNFESSEPLDAGVEVEVDVDVEAEEQNED